MKLISTRFRTSIYIATIRIVVRMTITPSKTMIEREYEWMVEQNDSVVPLINDVRELLSEQYGKTVKPVSTEEYTDSVTDVFEHGELAINVTALSMCLKKLHLDEDYTGFIVDEILGRELASMIAGRQPSHLFGQGTFYYCELVMDDDGLTTGMDDLIAGIAAGFQVRIPGWEWSEPASTCQFSPFSPDEQK